MPRVDTCCARRNGGCVRNRRALARAIDLVAFAGFVSLGQRFGGSAWIGFTLGALYLLAGDALGMSSKAWFGLGVVDVASGRRCSLAASALRNTPWLAAPLFRTAVEAFGFVDGVPSSPTVTIARGMVAALAVGVVVSLWRGLADGSGRHWADVLAGTQVVMASAARVTSMRSSQASSRTSSRTSSGPAATSGHRAAPDEDNDALDFDDADGEGTPKRPAPTRSPSARPRTDQDAIDFDDAAN